MNLITEPGSVNHWAAMVRLDKHPEIKIGYWPRHLPAEVFLWAKALCASGGAFRLCETLSAAQSQKWFCNHFADWAFLNPEGYQGLGQDIAQWVTRFCALVGASQCRVTLEVLQGDDKCRAFHVDYNDLRLVCTYWGPGTQWQEAGQLFQAQAGDGLLLRGHHHPLGGGALHRSPPISQTGQNRLLLRLDTVKNEKGKY